MYKYCKKKIFKKFPGHIHILEIIHEKFLKYFKFYNEILILNKYSDVKKIKKEKAKMLSGNSVR